MNAPIHASDDTLLDLVSGLHPPGKRNALLAHLGSCRECGERLRQFAGTHERARVRATRALASRRPPLRLRYALPWAAALVALFGAAWILAPHGREAAPAMAWLPAPDPAGATRDLQGGGPDPTLQSGLDAYRRHDAVAAARLLAHARAEGAWEDVRRLYLGSAQLQLDDARAALATLRTVDPARMPEPWRGEALATLALAFDRTGQGREADSLWRMLAAREDDLGRRARRALAPR